MPEAPLPVRQLANLLEDVLSYTGDAPTSTDRPAEVVLGKGSTVTIEREDQTIRLTPAEEVTWETYAIFEDGIQKLTELAGGLSSRPPLNSKVSVKVMRQRLKHLIGELPSSESGTPDLDQLASALQRLLDSVAPSIESWQAAVPIEGLALCAELPALEVAGVQIMPWVHLQWPQVQAAARLQQSGEVPDLSLSLPGAEEERIAAAWKDVRLVGVVAADGDEETAMDTARATVKEALDVLQSLALVWHPSPPRPILHIPETSPICVSSSLLFHEESERVAGSLQWRRKEFLQLEPRLLQVWQEEFALDAVCRAVVTKATEAQMRVSEAIQWLAKAVRSDDLHERTIFAAVALETLLSPSAEQVVEWVARSAAFLLGSDLRSRHTIYKEVKDLYGMRSRVVHGGTEPPTEERVFRLEWIALWTIVRFAGWQDIFATAHDFREWVNQRIFSVADDAPGRPSGSSTA